MNQNGVGQDPIIQVSPMGGLANRMIQYLAALALASRVPRARLAQIHLPEWGVQIAPAPQDDGPMEVVTAPRLDLDRLAAALNEGRLARVDIRSYAQDTANLLAPGACRHLFGGPQAAAGAGPGELLCNIRQGDILDGHHPDYVLLPIDFYAELAARTGLSPVFMGQLEDSPYLDALRARFPGAHYIPSAGGVADFALIRASHNIVPAVSTFSWLAAWLSDAARVFMPVVGLFHPLQSRTTRLLPWGDRRFRFTLFPFHYAVPVTRVLAAHAALGGLWRAMPHDRLSALLARDGPPRDRDDYLAAFDEAYYLTLYPDIAAAIMGSHMPSGRHHFERFGFSEGRQPCYVDAAWYCEAYPIAAVELSQGDAIDPVHHWLTLGRERGYARCATDS